MERGVKMEEEMKLHSFTVVVEFEVTCYTEEEAEEYVMDGSPVSILDIQDNGPIE